MCSRSHVNCVTFTMFSDSTVSVHGCFHEIPKMCSVAFNTLILNFDSDCRFEYRLQKPRCLIEGSTFGGA